MKYEDIISKIKDDEIVKIASDLVKIPSYTGLKNQEEKVAEYIYNLLKKENIEVEKYDVLNNRPNVIAKIKGRGTGRSLMLNGHMDTVPPYNSKDDPFSGEVKDGRLYGRGSCDMKGPIACMLGTLVAIKRSGVKLDGDLYFTGVINEEQLSEGTEYLVNNGPYTDAAIVGEPTGLNIAAGHRGLEWIEINFIGKATHGGTPQEGINAISKAAKFIRKIEDEVVPRFKERNHPLIGDPLLNFGVIEGGDQPSSVAGKCSLYIDRRWTPKESFDLVMNELKDAIEELKKEDNSFNAEVKRYFEDTDMMLHKPLEISLDHPIVKSLEKSIGMIMNKTPEIFSFQAWTDASLLSNYAKIPSVVFGPGYLKEAHSDLEYIDIDQLIHGYKIYIKTAVDFCTGEKND
jgi:acetylornithine deacetylase/succinyl-diaminopimelate desuccinylase